MTMNASATLSCPIANFCLVSPRRRAASPSHTLSLRHRLSGSMQTASFKSSTAGSFYDILRVDKTASLNEIKAAYRSLAKVYHPDAVGSTSDARDFIEIRNAYSTLSDPAARAMYDTSLTLRQRGRRVRSRVYPTRRWETDQCW